MKLIGIIKVVFRFLQGVINIRSKDSDATVNNLECLIEPWVLD